MATWQGRSLGALCAGLMGTWLIAAPLQAQPPSSADQVIVKFSSQSEAGQALAQLDLATVENPAEDARLLEIARRFGERIGVPLRLERLTSGRELLLAVDHEALAATAARRLRQRDDVIRVAVSGSDTEAPRLTVEFEPESAFAEKVASETRVALESRSGASGSLVEVVAEVLSSDGNRAVLALDLDALMTGLLTRLEADPDVQYAQRNLRLGPYGAGAGGPG